MHNPDISGILQALVLLGFLQGVIVGSLLWTSHRRKLPNRLLAGIIYLISLACLDVYGGSKNWFNIKVVESLIDLVPLMIGMAIGPLIYFYVRSSLDPAFRMGRWQRLQLLPVILDLAPSIVGVGFIAGVLLRWVKNEPGPVGAFIDTYNIYVDIPRWISISLYTGLSFKYLQQRKKANGGSVSADAMKWLRQFLLAFSVFQLTWLAYLIPYVIPRYTGWMQATFFWYTVYIPLVIMIYWLGINGYILSRLQSNAGTSAPLSSEMVEKTKDLLLRAMEVDKLYLRADLTLHALAAHLGLPPRIISTVLNQHVSKSFNAFVNTYRIEAFQEKVREADANRLTIAGIASACGFSSKATFQRVFKEMTGKLPSDFRSTL